MTTGTPDLAFADTVIVDDLADVIPPSGIVFNDETGAKQQVTAVAFPPAAVQDPGVATRLRFAFTRMRHGVNAQRAEMTLLWSATAALDAARDPTVAAHGTPTVGRRVRTLFSFFEWDRADLLRAAWIGLAVFFFAATIGAVFLELGPR